jgi:hypothetical protein
MTSEVDKCVKKFCEPKSKKIVKDITYARNFKKNKKYINKLTNEIKQLCEFDHCNPSCKETIFEKGNPNVLPKSPKMLKGLNSKTKKMVNKYRLQTRKKLFGKKKDILKDNFYEELPLTNIKNIKKKGAISGCTEFIVF